MQRPDFCHVSWQQIVTARFNVLAANEKDLFHHGLQGMKPTREEKELYKRFVLDTEHPFCWNCRKVPQPFGSYRPKDWYAPFMLERAHIVGGPGRKERREAVIILCTLCHKLSHGETFRWAEPLPHALTKAEMVWLKRAYDPRFYDHDLLGEWSIGKCLQPQKIPGYTL